MIRNLLLTGIFALFTLCTFAQNVRDVRINEILVFNSTNLEDDYGNRGAWVELYNTSHARISLAGCYLTVKQGDESMTYRIPTTDAKTSIGPLEYMVFYCEGTPTKGTFYTNFTLDKTGYLAFMNASNELIDQVSYSVSDQKEDVSMGLLTQGDQTVWTTLPYVTARTGNDMAEEVPQYELFRRRDPTGIVLAITAMSVVFSALLTLFLLFKVLGNIMLGIATKKAAKASAGKDAKPKATTSNLANEEVVAAIAIALKMHQEDLHDKESAILTINRVARAYSPWSSKIYGLSQLPNKK